MIFSKSILNCVQLIPNIGAVLPKDQLIEVSVENSTDAKARYRLVSGIVVLAIVAVMMASIALQWSPIAQPQAYHNFAEQRALLGIPHFGDVITNLAYVIVAASGLIFLVSRKGRVVLSGIEERLPFMVFFTAVGAVGIGSAYYHADPTNQTLLWDRLPMAVAFTAMLAAFVADRIHARAGSFVVLPLAVALGTASLVYWHIGEAAGRGDLRFYFLTQAFAFVLIPLICVLFRARNTNGRYVLYILLLYGLGVACEQFDVRIFDLLGGAVSGHTIKHILTAAAIYMVIPMLRRPQRDRLENAGMLS